MSPQTDVPNTEKSPPAERDAVLRVLYASSSFIAAFQVIWGLGQFPVQVQLAASTLSVSETEKVVGGMMGRAMGLSESGALVVARAFVTKYFGQPFVFVTHILPAPIWSAIVPFQLHPASRSPGLKKMHRTLGSTFFLLSTSMMVGFGAIMRKGLDIHPGAAFFQGAQGKTIREVPGLLKALVPAGPPTLFGFAAWFTYTMYRALNAARRKRFAEHEDWVIRHVASGQWVGLMRIFMTMFNGFPFGLKRYGDSQEVVSSVFLACGNSAWIACIVGAEVAVARVRAGRAKAKAARSAKRKNVEGEALSAVDAKELGA